MSLTALELRVPPVVVVLIVGASMWAIAKHVAFAPFDFPGKTVIAAIVGLTGIALGASGVMIFRRIRTTVHPGHPEKASSIVADGIYRVSRNPMYLGLLLLLAGWALLLGDFANIALLAFFVVYMNQFQIKPEEHALETKFGAAYVDYKSGVRRWL